MRMDQSFSDSFRIDRVCEYFQFGREYLELDLSRGCPRNTRAIPVFSVTFDLKGKVAFFDFHSIRSTIPTQCGYRNREGQYLKNESH